MKELNQVIIEGNIVRDASVKEISNGKRLCTISVASDRYFKDSKGEFQSEVSYFDVQAWGETFVSNVAKNGTKGRGVRIVGRLKQERWKADDGKTRSKIVIIAEHIDFKPAVLKQSDSDESERQNLKIASQGIMEDSELDENAEQTELICESVAETVF